MLSVHSAQYAVSHYKLARDFKGWVMQLQKRSRGKEDVTSLSGMV